MMKLLLSLIGSGVFLLGCNGLSTQRVTNKYFLVAMDGIKSETSLSYEVGTDGDGFIGVVDQMVFAVGFDSNFIIAKQRPSVDPEGTLGEKSVSYYIVTMAGRNENSGNKGVYGPFNEEDFYKNRVQMGVPKSLDFTIYVK